MAYIPDSLMLDLMNPRLRQMMRMIGRQASNNAEFVAALGMEVDGELTYWETILNLVDRDGDLWALAAFFNSPAANVYSAGGDFWKTLVLARIELCYRRLLMQCGPNRPLNRDALLGVFAALCHLLYSNYGSQDGMVTVVRRVTGDQGVFVGDVKIGWAAGGSTVANGKIVLAR